MMQKILCIEDEPDYRDSLSDFLRHNGYDVIESPDGQDGISKIESARPDLVLCDINMPSMDGFEVLSRVRTGKTEAAASPFIFLTARGQKQDISKGTMLGVDDYLVKPVDFDALLMKVKSRLAQTERTKRLFEGEVDNYKAMLLESLAHVLRTPLNSIMALTNLIKSGRDGAIKPQKMDEFIGIIGKSANDLLYAINNASDAMAMQCGKMHAQAKDCCPENVIFEAIYVLKEMLGQDVKVRYSIDEMLESVSCDDRMVIRAIASLALDILKKAGDHGLMINMEARPGKTLIALSEDNGLDIQQDDKYRPFNPIWLGDTAAAGNLLNIVFASEVAKQHGGRLDVASKNNGNMVRLVLG